MRSDGIPYPDVRSLWVDPNLSGRVLAATSSGLVETFDAGVTWATVSPAVTNGFFLDVTSSGDRPLTIFALRGGDLWRSTNAGLDWDVVLSQVRTSPGEPAVEIDAHNADIVYAGLFSQGLSRSVDGGDTWQLATGADQERSATSVASDPNVPGLVYVVLDGERVWQSSNFGETWSDITAGLPQGIRFYHMALDPFETGRLYLATTSSSFYVRDSRTGDWRNVGRPQPQSCIYGVCRVLPDPEHRGRVLMTSGSRLFEYQFDSDNDDVGNNVDNCIYAANPSQIDSDGDGIGNACDADIGPAENDCVVNFIDLGVLRAAFFSQLGATNWNPAADFDSNGVINATDLGILRGQFFQAPGPSAVSSACDGSGT
ncbi:MAG: hypothetical protein AB8G17_01245 [Gammaproteobacteria bacterium]